MDTLDVTTPLGPGRFHLAGEGGAGRLVLGHGAGGGVAASDLAAAARAGVDQGWRVALFEQPWKVAGGRVAPPPPRLDVAWLAAVPQLLAAPGWAAGPLVLGGRSAGARVACRTAVELAASGVCCLAFPLHPPGRPERSRAPELAGAAVPSLVVQGLRDPFGTPAEFAALGLLEPPDVVLVGVPGDHSLRAPGPVRAAVRDWLVTLSP